MTHDLRERTCVPSLPLIIVDVVKISSMVWWLIQHRGKVGRISATSIGFDKCDVPKAASNPRANDSQGRGCGRGPDKARLELEIYSFDGRSSLASCSGRD